MRLHLSRQQFGQKCVVQSSDGSLSILLVNVLLIRGSTILSTTSKADYSSATTTFFNKAVARARPTPWGISQEFRRCDLCCT